MNDTGQFVTMDGCGKILWCAIIRDTLYYTLLSIRRAIYLWKELVFLSFFWCFLNTTCSDATATRM